jgi:hypothetical protein
MGPTNYCSIANISTAEGWLPLEKLIFVQLVATWESHPNIYYRVRIRLVPMQPKSSLSLTSLVPTSLQTHTNINTWLRVYEFIC